MRLRFPRFYLSIALLLLWIPLIGWSTSRMLSYENTAGASATPPLQWPDSSPLARASGRPTLTVFLHPHCPCSRATVAELAELAATSPDPARYNVVFVTPDGVPDGWSHTDLYRSFAARPDFRVYLDRNGVEARRFGVETSGTAVLYDSRGRLRFHGGITLSRGMPGDNPGVRSLRSLLVSGNTARPETPVFGCSLRTPAAPGLDRTVR